MGIAKTATGVGSDHWFGGTQKFFKIIYRCQIEFVSHDSWTVRPRSLSSRRPKRKILNIRSKILKLKIYCTSVGIPRGRARGRADERRERVTADNVSRLREWRRGRRVDEACDGRGSRERSPRERIRIRAGAAQALAPNEPSISVSAPSLVRQCKAARPPTPVNVSAPLFATSSAGGAGAGDAPSTPLHLVQKSGSGVDAVPRGARRANAGTRGGGKARTAQRARARSIFSFVAFPTRTDTDGVCQKILIFAAKTIGCPNAFPKTSLTKQK